MATSKPATGRDSIFRHKEGGDRVQGVITKIGSVKFEQARARLGKLAHRATSKISDGDTIEFLSRGEAETRKYLAAKEA